MSSSWYASISGAVVGIVVALVVFAWQKHDAAELNRKVDKLTEMWLDHARNVSPDEIVEAIARTADVSVSAHAATVGPSAAADELASRVGGDPAAIAELVARLPDREKIVVSLYYYDHLTMREIGEVLGVSESRVSRLHKQAITRLRGATA